jgi:chitodextrinase
MNANLHKDQTPPTIFYPQRFPWNPGGWTFGWFNPTQGNNNYLKKMNSEFYIWTHVYDVSGVQSVNLKIRMDNDGVNPLASHQNETYAGGPEVGPWITIPMTKKTLPRTRAELNAAANNAQINYFIELPPGKLADYYYAKIHDGNVPNFRGKLFDYYIEATDTKGNIAKTDIQHVFVEDDGNTPTIPSTPTGLNSTIPSATQINLTWNPVPGATTYIIKRNNVQIATTTTPSYNDTGLIPQTQYCYKVAAQNTAGTSPDSAQHCATTPAAVPPPTPTGFTSPNQTHNTIQLTWTSTPGAAHYTLRRNNTIIATNLTTTSYTDTGLTPTTSYTYTLQAHNTYGDSPQTAPLTVATTTAPINFNMDGQFESPNYLVADNGMRLYAAVRGTKLYVATWATGASPASNDHFIFITDTLLPSATTPAVWAKAGQTAIPANKPYLAGEGSNNYRAWFNAGTTHQSAEGTGPQALEGVIDLVEAFGTIPQNLYIAAVAYGNPDGAGIASQAPAGNGNNILEPAEFFHITPQALRDENADFTFDRLDPTRDFLIQQTTTPSGNLQITFNTFPGRTYQVQHSPDMITWTNLGSPITAANGEVTKTYTHTGAITNHQRNFYRIRLLNP